MNLEFDLTDDVSNTQYAPLAALCAHYQQNQVLAPLEKVTLQMKTRDFSPVSKLKQVLVSILAGCETLTAFNHQLDGEVGLAGSGDRIVGRGGKAGGEPAAELAAVDQADARQLRDLLGMNH